jgi:hypothetical protein
VLHLGMPVALIEGLFVAIAATALGVVVVAVAPDHLPEPIRAWTARLGRFRRAFGVGCILVGLACAALALTGNW